MPRNLKSLLFKVLTISNILFLFLFGCLSYYNRISVDDFYFLGSVNDHGIIQGTINEHNSWSGRWAAVFLVHFVLSFYQFKYFLFVFGLVLLALFIAAIFRLVKSVNSSFQLYSLSHFQTFNFSIFIVSAVFYSTFKIGETWFWLCASCNYLLSGIMALLGISTIIYPHKKFSNALICVFSFTYVAGACEPLALIVMLLLIIVGGLLYFKTFNLPLPKPLLMKRIGLAFTCCFLSFIVLYIAKGNRVREQFFDDITFWEAFIYNFKTTAIIFLIRLPQVLPLVLLFTIPFYFFPQREKQRLLKSQLLYRLIMLIILYLIIVFVYQLPVTYVTQDVAAYRTLFPVTLLTILACIVGFYLLGLNAPSPKKSRIIIIPIILICLLNVYTLIQQLQVVPAYAEAYDKRMEILANKKNQSSTIVLDKLPSSGLLYSSEISTDSLCYVNVLLKQGLKLKSQVILVP